MSAKNYLSQISLESQRNKKITDWCCCYIPLCHQYINLYIETWLNTKTDTTINMLDMGCGNGQFTQYLHNIHNKYHKNINLIGCDVFSSHIKLANEIRIGPKYVLVPKALKGDLPFATNAFNIVTCMFVISCMKNNKELTEYFKQIKRVLKDKNSMFLLVVNNPKEIVGNRFSGLQIASLNGVHNIKPLDKVHVKFYETIKHTDAYCKCHITWRSVDMVQNILMDVFNEVQWNVKYEELNHKSKFDSYVTQLNINPDLLILERIKYPFTVFIVESNNFYTKHKNKGELLINGYTQNVLLLERITECDINKINGIIFDYYI